MNVTFSLGFGQVPTRGQDRFERSCPTQFGPDKTVPLRNFRQRSVPEARLSWPLGQVRSQ